MSAEEIVTLPPDAPRVLVAEQTLLDGKFQPRMAVFVERGRISRVCQAGELSSPEALHDQGIQLVECGRRLLAPGTLNAHNHSFQSLLRGIGDDCDFFTWRDRALYGYTPYMDEETIYQGARFAFAEMIRNGVTTVCDFFYIHRDSNANDRAVIRAARELGMRIVLARTMYDWEGAPQDYQERVEDAVARTRELWQEYRGSDDAHVCPAPHSPHAASPAMIQAGARLAEELDTRFHIHVAEGRYERDMIRERSGMTPVRWLESLGVALERMTLIHGCWLETDDIQLLAERDARLVYNPASNMFLGDGITPIVEMLAAGVKIGLGSDGGCSNNRVSVFDEMRTCALLQKVRHLSSEVVPAEVAFAMGTAGGAETLGLDAGRIAPGCYADFVFLDMDDPSLQPPWSHEKNVVYSMTPHAIREVMIAGRTVFQEGRLSAVTWEDVLGGLHAVTATWPR
jgi:5-methylthioadenosine/S-adenosylhomocysteine deaminase